MVKISPSLLACDFSKIGQELAETEAGGAEYIHLDVMDGIFVPNISFGFPIISSMRPKIKMVFDTHLMIIRPELYATRFIEAGADIITAHVEAVSDVPAFCRLVHEKGAKVALSVKPCTPAKVLFPWLPLLDMVLVMTVEPGYGGQKLIPETIGKISELKTEIDRLGLNVDIEVDGGVTSENAPTLIAAGANILVAGSAVFKGNDRAANINALRG